IRGTDPFAGVAIRVEDLRRAIEAQAKSHLIHLREAFLEAHGEATRISGVIAGSAGPFRALLSNIARLPAADGVTPSDDALATMAEERIGLSGAVVREVLASTVTDPSHLFSRYLDAAQKVWEFVDGWSSR